MRPFSSVMDRVRGHCHFLWRTFARRSLAAWGQGCPFCRGSVGWYPATNAAKDKSETDNVPTHRQTTVRVTNTRLYAAGWTSPSYLLRLLIRTTITPRDWRIARPRSRAQMIAACSVKHRMSSGLAWSREWRTDGPRHPLASNTNGAKFSWVQPSSTKKNTKTVKTLALKSCVCVWCVHIPHITL